LFAPIGELQSPNKKIFLPFSSTMVSKSTQTIKSKTRGAAVSKMAESVEAVVTEQLTARGIKPLALFSEAEREMSDGYRQKKKRVGIFLMNASFINDLHWSHCL
jgi:hypothetical protein